MFIHKRAEYEAKNYPIEDNAMYRNQRMPKQAESELKSPRGGVNR